MSQQSPGISRAATIRTPLRFRRKDILLRRHWLRFVARAVGQATLAGGLALIGSVLSAQAQNPAALEYSPARLIPADNLLLFAEFDGLDAHAEPWHKTAAYRILTETSTGAMLEDLFVQAVPRSPQLPLAAADLLKAVKHLSQAGFTMGHTLATEAGQPRFVTVIAIRQAFSNQEVRPIFARLLQSLPKEGTKPQVVSKAGLKIVTGQVRDRQFFWWVEGTKKEDLILVLGSPGADDVVLEVLNGQRPSVLTHPARTELLQAQAGFDRTGFAFLDAAVGMARQPDANPSQFFRAIKIDRIDFQGGFQDDALMSMTRLHSTAVPPAAGPTPGGFDKSTIPGVPAGVLGLMVMAFDLNDLANELRTSQTTSRAYTEWVANLKEKSKIDFEESVVKQLGPKITTYIAPNKATSSTASALPNALGLLASMGVGGGDTVPKLAILIDVANAAKFGQTVDELMSYVNKELKTAFAPPARPEGEAGQPPPGRGRGRGPAVPAPEFRVMSGETKSYVFTVPPQLSNAFPPSFRPTIRVGARQVALAVSADVARQALEAKGTYTPPAEIAAAFAQLPAQLNWLLVVDPRESTPEILASLPARLQAGINTMTTPATADPAAAAPTPGSGSPSSGPGGPARLRNSPLVSGMETASPNGAPGTMPPSGPGSSPVSTAPGPLILKVDADKLPAADAIRKLLFPAIYTLDQQGNMIRFTSRAAFPPIPDPSVVGLIGRAYRMRQLPGGGAGMLGAKPSGGGNPSQPGRNSNPNGAPGITPDR